MSPFPSFSSSQIAWGFYSDSQVTINYSNLNIKDSLLELCTKSKENKILWQDFRNFGIGYWLKNPEQLVLLQKKPLYYRKKQSSLSRETSI